MAVGLDTAGSPESPPRAALAAAASRADGSRCRRTPGRTLAARAAHRLAAAALAVFSLAATAERLTLDGSQALEHPLFLYGNGHFTTPDGASVARDRAVDWWLVPARAGAAAAPAAGQDDPVVTRRLREYRERGRQMAAEFPGVSGVQILDDGEYELTADRRHVYRYHFAGLILNEELLEWGDIALGFSEGRSRTRILAARCLTPDDRLLTLDPAAATVSTPTGGDEHFDPNARVLSATVPGTEVGALVELLYEHETYAPEDWRLFFPRFYFQGDLPVWQSTFVVRVPADVELHTWEENWHDAREESGWRRWLGSLRSGHGQAAVVTRAADADGHPVREYRWEKRAIPPIVPEPQMPPWHMVAPAVYATLLPDWDYLNRLTGAMQRERMALTPPLRELAAGLTASAADDDARVAALYHWVQKNIRYISVKSSLSSGWAGHPAQETLDQGYGDCTDKSVLFATLLAAVGIEAEPVVVRTNDEGVFVPRLPFLACNHCITEVRLGERTLYLDATSQDYRYPAFRDDDHGAYAINFITGRHRLIPVPPGLEASGKEARDEMTLAADGTLTVHSHNTYTGAYEANLRANWKRVPAEARRPMMQQYLNGMAPGAELTDFELGAPQDLSRPFYLDYHYRLPDYAVAAGPYRILQFPERELEFPELSLETRRYPLAYRTTEGVRRRAEVELAPSLTAVELPADYERAGRHLHYRESFRQIGNTIVFTSEYVRKSREIPAADYAAYRADALAIAEASQQPVYLQVSP